VIMFKNNGFIETVIKELCTYSMFGRKMIFSIPETLFLQTLVSEKQDDNIGMEYDQEPRTQRCHPEI